MSKTSSKPMVISAEVVEVEVVVIVLPIIVDYLAHTSWRIHSERIDKVNFLLSPFGSQENNWDFLNSILFLANIGRLVMNKKRHIITCVCHHGWRKWKVGRWRNRGAEVERSRLRCHAGCEECPHCFNISTLFIFSTPSLPYFNTVLWFPHFVAIFAN